MSQQTSHGMLSRQSTSHVMTENPGTWDFPCRDNVTRMATAVARVSVHGSTYDRCLTCMVVLTTGAQRTWDRARALAATVPKGHPLPDRGAFCRYRDSSVVTDLSNSQNRKKNLTLGIWGITA